MGGRGANAPKAQAYDLNKLPALQGTEKQISWAEQIRGDYVRWVKEYWPLSEVGARNLSIPDANRMSGLETLLFHNRVAGKEREIKKALGVEPGKSYDKTLSKEERKLRRQAARKQLDDWKRSYIGETLKYDQAKHWIENMRPR